jgi:hypothetical protein
LFFFPFSASSLRAHEMYFSLPYPVSSPVVGEVPTKRSSDHGPMIRHCRIIGRFET